MDNDNKFIKKKNPQKNIIYSLKSNFIDLNYYIKRYNSFFKFKTNIELSKINIKDYEILKELIIEEDSESKIFYRLLLGVKISNYQNPDKFGLNKSNHKKYQRVLIKEYKLNNNKIKNVNFFQEFTIINKILSNNDLILKYIEDFEYNNNHYTIFDFNTLSYSNNLHNLLIIKKKKLNNLQIYQIFLQICLAIYLLQEYKIIHNTFEIKFIYYKYDIDRKFYSVKISEFDNSFEKDKYIDIVDFNGNENEVSKKGKKKLDEEILKRDIYHLGIVCYSLIYNEYPENLNKIFNLQQNSDLEFLLKKMVVDDFSKRYNIYEILTSKYFFNNIKNIYNKYKSFGFFDKYDDKIIQEKKYIGTYGLYYGKLFKSNDINIISINNYYFNGIYINCFNEYFIGVSEVKVNEVKIIDKKHKKIIENTNIIYGLFCDKDKNIYCGEWDNNKYEGKGILYDYNGNKYIGEFNNGKKNGQGIMYYNKKEIYDGEWKNNLKHGKGRYYFNNGEIYDGEWKKNKNFGKCIYYFNNGDIFDGYILDDKFYNKGRYYNSNLNNIFEGFWFNSSREGKGIYYYSDFSYKTIYINRNNIFDSIKEDENNLLENNNNKEKNEYYDIKKGEKYIGKINDNLKKEREGILYNIKGEKFEGFFNNNEFKEGIFYYNNKEKYIGKWKNNKKNGLGTFYYYSKNKYEGDWNNDLKEGKGKYFYKNGNVFKGYWQKDKNVLGIIKNEKINVKYS
jgi:hypothetical protein